MGPLTRCRGGFAAAGLLLATFLAVRLCRPPQRPPAPRGVSRPLEVPLPDPVSPSPSLPDPRPVLSPAVAAPRADLGPWLERLGRARLMRDQRTLERLRGEVPSLGEDDVPLLLSSVRSDLFRAAGAAELIRWYGLRAAVPALVEVLSRDAHPFLKGVVIDALAGLGGDVAAAGLIAVLQNDPDPFVRARCAAALGSFETQEAYQALAGALRNPLVVVRCAAAEALRRLKSPRAVELLVGALGEETDPLAQADLASAAFAAGGEPLRPLLLEFLRTRPGATAVLDRRRRLRDGSRYGRPYDAGFFAPGQPAASWDPSWRSVGVTVELGEGVTLPEAASAIFSASPFDRYRTAFRFRRSDEFPSPRAYDSYGSPMGDVPYDDLDGTVYLHFRSPDSFKPGVLGFAEGHRAYVQPVSLLHELGHAFARLGDEYPGGSLSDAPNLARPGGPVPWQPLVESGLLGAPARRDGTFLIPSEDCHLGNRLFPTRYCPVCQLEIIARFCDLTGAPPPW